MPGVGHQEENELHASACFAMNGKADHTLDPQCFDAAILDLDGVVTRTAAVHARAWKRMFDGFLGEHAGRAGRAWEPFDVVTDYRRYVDGKPRYDGVRDFLAARGIELPWGDTTDGPRLETVCGLGNRKNESFRQALDEDGVEVFPSTVERVREWRARGLKTAVVSSSKNCAAVLEAAKLAALFDVRVDGIESERLKLKGKPAPDIFLEAARRLGVDPSRAFVIEDAVAGVQAGRAGGFALVIGLDRTGDEAALRKNGAHVVLRDLAELRTKGAPPGQGGHSSSPDDAAAQGGGDAAQPESRAADGVPAVRDCREEIARRLAGRRPVVFLDYDGTLTPIVSRPELAVLAPGMRDVLRELSSRATVAIVSGRDRRDVEKLVGLGELVYAGSHGFDIAGPKGLKLEHEKGEEFLADLDRAEGELRERLGLFPGTQVERKRFAVAVHYRNVAERDVGDVLEATAEVLGRFARLRRGEGKKVVELRPDIEWDKGRAVLWLLERLGLDEPGVVPLYLGDDITDEDAFGALAGRGIGVLVGDHGQPTAAAYRLKDVPEAEEFLRYLGGLEERGKT